MTVLPATTVTLLGDAEREKSRGTGIIVSWMEAVLVMPPQIPVMIRVLLPNGVEELVVNVRVELNGGTPALRVKLPFTPDGRLDMLKVTG